MCFMILNQTSIVTANTGDVAVEVWSGFLGSSKDITMLRQVHLVEGKWNPDSTWTLSCAIAVSAEKTQRDILNICLKLCSLEGMMLKMIKERKNAHRLCFL